MKDVDFVDETGRTFRVRVPDECPPENYHQGIRIGPPLLSDLGWPESIEIRLHNALHSRRIFTAKDVMGRPRDVQAAIMAACKLDMQRLQRIYLEH